MPKQPTTANHQQQDMLAAAKPSPTAWFKHAMLEALQQQLKEDQALDAWIETEELRHTDPYDSSKEGDAAYWTQ